jgi:hypothetical protein
VPTSASHQISQFEKFVSDAEKLKLDGIWTMQPLVNVSADDSAN